MTNMERREFIGGALAVAGAMGGGSSAGSRRPVSQEPPAPAGRDFTVTIRSGGQSGVDQAALDFAIDQKWPYAGWCPRGGWAENHQTPPGVRARYKDLTETPAEKAPETASEEERARYLQQRTAWNVRDSHATLILVRGDALKRSAGTKFTQDAAELMFLRPCRVVDITEPDSAATVRDWLQRTASSLNVSELVLNIAGPRESQDTGIHRAAQTFLEELFLTKAPGARYALWLAPAAEHEDLLNRIIIDLADRYNTPRFLPHATLRTGEWRGDFSMLKSAVNGLCGQFPDAVLPVKGLAHGDRWSTFFHIKLGVNDRWTELQTKAALAIPGSAPPDIGPHVSLIYSNGPGERRKDPRNELAKELRDKLPAQMQVVFDSVKLVMPATNEWKDVEGWEVKHTCRFAI